jgi:hypothetical protein
MVVRLIRLARYIRKFVINYEHFLSILASVIENQEIWKLGQSPELFLFPLSVLRFTVIFLRRRGPLDALDFVFLFQRIR